MRTPFSEANTQNLGVPQVVTGWFDQRSKSLGRLECYHGSFLVFRRYLFWLIHSPFQQLIRGSAFIKMVMTRLCQPQRVRELSLPKAQTPNDYRVTIRTKLQNHQALWTELSADWSYTICPQTLAEALRWWMEYFAGGSMGTALLKIQSIHKPLRVDLTLRCSFVVSWKSERVLETTIY